MTIPLTNELPTEPGFYYWTHFGEHTPTILNVRWSYSGGHKHLWADNGEYCFPIQEKSQGELELDLEDEGPVFKNYKYGDELWGKIPMPSIDGEEVKLDCF